MQSLILGGWEQYIPQNINRIALTNYTRACYIAEEEDINIYPPTDKIFAALQMTPPEKTRCVILGQDPYHGPGQANGLAFSVNPDCKLPPSLRNIFKELQDDLGCAIPANGDLSHWAEQGVLLLNTVLTVEEKKPGSHSSWGWQTFTQSILRATRQFPQPICFILWGNHAIEAAKAAQINESAYPRLFLHGPHPSPLSAYRGFFGSKPFSKTNEFLTEHGAKPINW